MVSQHLKRKFPVCTPNGAARGAVRLLVICLSCVFLAGTTLGLSGCGEKEPSDEELVLGNWTQYKNRAYILLIINPKGTWNSSVRIADVTSKIVSSRGNANGSWHMEEGQLIFTVVESDIEEVWEKNDTTFFEIVELGERMMLLKEENGRVGEWNKTSGQKGPAAEGEVAQIIEMAPYAVNLNKNSSNVQDRYLCMNMHMVLKELMPDQEVPKFHPRARDAAILFLSSLVYGDVENFDKIKAQKKKLVDVLNPYMEGFIKDIDIEHVIIATSVTKVEEFIIEHTIGKDEEEGEGEDGEDGDGKADDKSA
ncbi:MAG: flagellar basal body-associated FliL family protein [Desulfobacterales bacterium]|nr:flagellar basal body-associated FliL family protein [Desulfobacterales bacterium]